MDQSLSQAEIMVDENKVELLYIKSNITNMRDDFNDLEANCTEKIQELQGLFASKYRCFGRIRFFITFYTVFYIILKKYITVYVLICSILGRANGLEFIERSMKSSTKRSVKKADQGGLKSVSGQFLRRNDEMLNPKKPTFVKGRN